MRLVSKVCSVYVQVRNQRNYLDYDVHTNWYTYYNMYNDCFMCLIDLILLIWMMQCSISQIWWCSSPISDLQEGWYEILWYIRTVGNFLLFAFLYCTDISNLRVMFMLIPEAYIYWVWWYVLGWRNYKREVSHINKSGIYN